MPEALPTAETPAPPKPSPAGQKRYRRSRLLVVQWIGKDLVLLNCDTLRQFRVDTRLLEFIGGLDEWASIAEIQDSGRAIDERQIEGLVEMGVLEVAGPQAGEEGSRHYWDPLDLAVHRRHNFGGYREEVVREKRERGELPPPAFKPVPQGRVTILPKALPLPRPLDEVLNSRRSIRTYGDRPLKLEELSSVLWHSARIAGTLTDPFLGEHAFKPYPAGGGRSEHEIYVVANDVEGLEAGAHYFDARDHRLIQIKYKDEHQETINTWGSTATGGSLNRAPNAIFLITAVFARIMWKYQGIGLSTILRNTGSLYQTLYLTSTALGLAPCGIGGGPELANARWLGLDPLIESQVGAVLLGTRPEA